LRRSSVACRQRSGSVKPARPAASWGGSAVPPKTTWASVRVVSHVFTITCVARQHPNADRRPGKCLGQEESLRRRWQTPRVDGASLRLHMLLVLVHLQAQLALPASVRSSCRLQPFTSRSHL